MMIVGPVSQPLVFHLVQNVRPPAGVTLNHSIFFIGQFAGFIQNIIRNGYFANVVQ